MTFAACRHAICNFSTPCRHYSESYLGDKLPAGLDAPALGPDVVLEVAVVRRQRRRAERRHDVAGRALSHLPELKLWLKSGGGRFVKNV